MRSDILERESEIKEWIFENKTKAFMSRELHCKPLTLNSYLKKMGIVYKGNAGGKGLPKSKKSIPIDVYLDNQKTIASYRLKNRLIESGIKEAKCECCGLSKWLGREIPLELHHKDGQHYNNNIDNIILLCPNCHALTDFYRGRGKKNHKEKSSSPCIEVKPIDNKKHCVDCGAIIRKSSTRCKTCEAKRRASKSARPTREVLKSLIRNYSILHVGRMYKVSDNAIRKWCKYYGLPSQKYRISKYSDEEWSTI